MTDNVAVLKGFTQEVEAFCDDRDLNLLVRPGTDYDGWFKAWDLAEQEFIHINGWLFEIREV